MQRDMVPVETAPDSQVESRLAPRIAGQELTSAVIQDTVKYLGIQPTGISQLNGPYIQVRPAGEDASDILLVGSWRTHFHPGDDHSGEIIDSLRPALRGPAPTAHILGASPVATNHNDQRQAKLPYGVGRAVLAQTSSLDTPGAAAVAMAAATGAPGGVAAAHEDVDMMHVDAQQRMEPAVVGHGTAGDAGPSYNVGPGLGAAEAPGQQQGPDAGTQASAPRVNRQPIVEECLSDAEPAPPRHHDRQRSPHGHRRGGSGHHHHHHHDHHHHHGSATQQVPGLVHASDVRMDPNSSMSGGSAGGTSYMALTMQPAEAVPCEDRVMEDVAAQGGPSQPPVHPQRAEVGPPAVDAEAPTVRAVGAVVPTKVALGNGGTVHLQGPARTLVAAAAAAQVAMGPSIVPAAAALGAGTLVLSPRPRSEWELDPAKIRIERRLAVGGFGEVFLAKYEGTLVAVKRLLATDSDTTQRFVDEVHMLARLRHPNLLLFMGYTLTPEPSIVTEFMARGSLFHILRQAGNRPPDPRMQRAVAVAVARGMAYLHSRSPPILHLDLKSPNVLVDDRWRVKIADFGLSRVRQRTYISSGAAAGSPEWMAPEVLRCDHYAEAADVYSYGVVLWELLTGKAPWADLNAMQVVGAVGFARRSLPDPAEGDALLLQLCKACRSQEPTQRPSFAQIIEAFERHPAASATSAPAATAAAAAGAPSGAAEPMALCGGARRQLPALPAPERQKVSGGDGDTAAATTADAAARHSNCAAAPVAAPAVGASVLPGGGAARPAAPAASPFAAAAATRLTRRHSLAAGADDDVEAGTAGGFNRIGAARGSADGPNSAGGAGTAAVPRIDARFASVHESPRSRRRYRSPRSEDMLGPPPITARLQDGRKTPSPRTASGRSWRSLLTSASSDEKEYVPRKPQAQGQQPPGQVAEQGQARSLQPQAQRPKLTALGSGAVAGAGGVPRRGAAVGASPFAAVAASEFGPESLSYDRPLRVESNLAAAGDAPSSATARSPAEAPDGGGGAGAGANAMSVDVARDPSCRTQSMELGSPVAASRVLRGPPSLAQPPAQLETPLQHQDQRPVSTKALQPEASGLPLLPGATTDIVLPLPPAYVLNCSASHARREAAAGSLPEVAVVSAAGSSPAAHQPSDVGPVRVGPSHVHTQESCQGVVGEHRLPLAELAAAGDAAATGAQHAPSAAEELVQERQARSTQAVCLQEQGAAGEQSQRQAEATGPLALSLDADVGIEAGAAGQGSRSPHRDEGAMGRPDGREENLQQQGQEQQLIDLHSQVHSEQGQQLFQPQQQQHQISSGIVLNANSTDHALQPEGQQYPEAQPPAQLPPVPQAGNPVVARQLGMSRFNGLRPGHRRVSSDEASRLMRMSAALGSSSAGGAPATVAPSAGAADAVGPAALGGGPGGQAGAAAPAPGAASQVPSQWLQNPLQEPRRLAASGSFGGGSHGGGSGMLPPQARRSRGLGRNSAPMRYTYGSGNGGPAAVAAGPGQHHSHLHPGGSFLSPPRPRSAHHVGFLSAAMHQQQAQGMPPPGLAAAADLPGPGPSSPLHRGLARSAPGTPGAAAGATSGTGSAGSDWAGPALGATMSLSPMSLDAAAPAADRSEVAGGTGEPYDLPAGMPGPGAALGAGGGDPWPDTHSELSFAFILRDNVSVCSDDYLQSTSLDRLPLLEEDAMDATIAEESESDPLHSGFDSLEEGEDADMAVPAGAEGAVQNLQDHTTPGAERLDTGSNGLNGHHGSDGQGGVNDLEFELPRPFLKAAGSAQVQQQGEEEEEHRPPSLALPMGPARTTSGAVIGEVAPSHPIPLGVAAHADAGDGEADLWAALQQHSLAAQQQQNRGSVSMIPASPPGPQPRPCCTGISPDMRAGGQTATVPPNASPSETPHMNGASAAAAHVEPLQAPRVGLLKDQPQVPMPAGLSGTGAARPAEALAQGQSAGMGLQPPADGPGKPPLRTSTGGATKYRSGRFTVTIEPSSSVPPAEAQPAAAQVQPSQLGPADGSGPSQHSMPHPPFPPSSQPPERPLQHYHSMSMASGYLAAAAAAGDADTQITCAAAAAAAVSASAPASPPRASRLSELLAGDADAAPSPRPQQGQEQQGEGAPCPNCFRSVSCNGFAGGNDSGANGGPSSPGGPGGSASASGAVGTEAPGTAGRMRATYNGYSSQHSHSHSHSHHLGHPGELPPPLALNTVTMYRKGRFFISSHAAGTHSLSVINPMAATSGATSSQHTMGGSGAAGGGSGAHSLHDDWEEHEGGSGPSSPFAAVASAVLAQAQLGGSQTAGDGPPPATGAAAAPAKLSWAAVAAMPPPSAAAVPPRQESLGRQYSCGRFTVAESIVAAPEPRRPSAGSGTAATPVRLSASGGGTGDQPAAAGPAVGAAAPAAAPSGSGVRPPPQSQAAPTLQAPPHLHLNLQQSHTQQPQPHHSNAQQPPQQPGPDPGAAPMRFSLNGADGGGGGGSGSGSGGGAAGGAQPMWTSAPTSPRGEQVVVRKVGRFTVREVDGGSNASSRAPSSNGTPTPPEGPRRVLDAHAAAARLAGISGGTTAAAGGGSGGAGAGGGPMQGSPPDDAAILSSHHSSCSFATASRTSSGSHGPNDLEMYAAPPRPPQQPLQPLDGQRPPALDAGLMPMRLGSAGLARPAEPQQQQPGAPQAVAVPDPAAAAAGAVDSPTKTPPRVLRVKSRGRFTVIEHEAPTQGNQQQHRQQHHVGNHPHHHHQHYDGHTQQQQQQQQHAGSMSGLPPTAPREHSAGGAAPAALPHTDFTRAPAEVGASGGTAVAATTPAVPLHGLAGSPSQAGSGLPADGGFASYVAGASAAAPTAIAGTPGCCEVAIPHGGVLRPRPAPRPPVPRASATVPGPQPAVGPANDFPAAFGQPGARPPRCQPQGQQAGADQGPAVAVGPWGLQLGPQDSEQAARFQADTARLVLERMERNAQQQQQQQQQPAGQQQHAQRDQGGAGEEEEEQDGAAAGGGAARCTYEVSFGDGGLTIQITHDVPAGGGAGGAHAADGGDGDGDEVMLDVGIVQEAAEDEEAEEAPGEEEDAAAAAALGEGEEGEEFGEDEDDDDWEFRPLRPPETPAHEPAERERSRRAEEEDERAAAARRRLQRRRRLQAQLGLGAADSDSDFDSSSGGEDSMET